MQILLILMVALSPVMKRRLFDFWGYAPGEKQSQVHYEGTKYRFIAVKGGNRSGKSRMAGNEGAASVQLPNQSIWITAPTYDLADKVYRIVHDSGAVKIGHHLLIDRQSAPAEFKTSMGTTVWTKSWDHLQSLEGEGVNKLISDEWGFANKTVSQRLLVRLDQENSQWIVILTPKGKNAWAKEWWHERETSPEWLTVCMPTDEVEYRNKQFIEDAEREFGGKDSPAYREQIRGEFVMYGLLVYPMFTEKNIQAQKIVKSWRYLVGADPGYIHPCVASHWLISPGDFCYRFAEYHKQYMTRAENAENIVADIGRHQKTLRIRCDGLFYDPSDPSWGKDLKKAAKKHNILGGKIYGANNDVERGVELVRTLMPTQIAIDPKCKHGIFDYQNYSHKENSEVIQKIHDDHCDSDRYCLLGHFGKPKMSYYKAF